MDELKTGGRLPKETEVLKDGAGGCDEQTDIFFMRQALALAEEAAAADEVPVGAVIVYRGEVIAAARNRREEDKCATHHAEILAIERACALRGGWRLPDCTLYVTLEPCPMCGGAIVNARISRVVFGAPDSRAGVFGSAVQLNDLPLNHKPALCGGVLCEESASILSAYFKRKRKN